MLVSLMGSSFLSEVDHTSILRTGLSTRYRCALDWLRALGSCPREAGWSAATLCPGPNRRFRQYSTMSAMEDKPDGRETRPALPHLTRSGHLRAKVTLSRF